MSTSSAPNPSKRSLSPCRRDLVELMQKKNFCTIEGLIIRNGEPVLEPLPRIVREIKLGGENGSRPEAAARDFLLKAQVVELFALIDKLRDGTIELLEIKNGLPFRLYITEPGT